MNINKLSFEKIFLGLALIFGLLYVFILPPFQSVDEGMHFFRTYQISTGRFVAKNIDGKIGDNLPKSLSNFYNLYTPFIKHIDEKIDFNNIKRDFKLPLTPQDTQFTEFTNTALYSPVCYISQLPGVITAKMLNLGLAAIYYLGRLSNLIAYCIIVFLALRITPFFKAPMTLLALMPMSLSLAGAFTCDVAVLGLNFLWVSVLLKALTTPEKLSKKYILSLAVLAFLITLSKSYILLLPLIFLLPIDKFIDKKAYVIGILSVILAAVTGVTIWYLSSKGLSLNMNNTVANSAGQIDFIKSHPIIYIGVLIKTFFVKTPRILITMIGVLGWQDTKLDWITYIAYPILMYFAIFSDKFDFTLKKWQKYLLAFTLVAGTIMTYTSLYVMWSPVANPIVLGLNGKYFIPLMLPLFLLFKNGIGKYDENKVKLAIFIGLVLILVSSELSLLHRFYNITPQLYYKI